MRQTVFLLALAVPLFAQDLISAKYPLLAHIKEVRLEKDSDFKDGSGGTYDWHLMVAEIEGHTYGLEVNAPSYAGITLAHREWLLVGNYACRRTKNGFDFQYTDKSGKLRHEELHIVSEEN